MLTGDVHLTTSARPLSGMRAMRPTHQQFRAQRQQTSMYPLGSNSRLSTRFISVSTLGLILVGCSGCMQSRDIVESPPASAVVYGHVTRSGSAPILDAGVVVWFTDAPGPCQVGQAGSDSPRVRTNAAGRYRVELRSSASPTLACVTVVVDLTPAGAGIGAPTLVGGGRRVELRSSATAGAPDSLSVNVQLP